MLEFGGWIGSTALMAAARGAEVHSYEPDPYAIAGFRRHMDMNPRLAKSITLHEQAVHIRTARATICSSALGDSTSSLLKRRGQVVDVETISISDIASEPWFINVSLLKLDIEGGEYVIGPALGRALGQRRPTLLLSTHSDYLNDAAAGEPKLARRAKTAVRLLRHARLVWDFRVYNYWHVPSGHWWIPISRLRSVLSLLSSRNQEFLITTSPLSRVARYSS